MKNKIATLIEKEIKKGGADKAALQLCLKILNGDVVTGRKMLSIVEPETGKKKTITFAGNPELYHKIKNLRSDINNGHEPAAQRFVNIARDAGLMGVNKDALFLLELHNKTIEI